MDPTVDNGATQLITIHIGNYFNTAAITIALETEQLVYTWMAWEGPPMDLIVDNGAIQHTQMPNGK